MNEEFAAMCERHVPDRSRHMSDEERTLRAKLESGAQVAMTIDDKMFGAYDVVFDDGTALRLSYRTLLEMDALPRPMPR